MGLLRTARGFRTISAGCIAISTRLRTRIFLRRLRRLLDFLSSSCRCRSSYWTAVFRVKNSSLAVFTDSAQLYLRWSQYEPTFVPGNEISMLLFRRDTVLVSSSCMRRKLFTLLVAAVEDRKTTSLRTVTIAVFFSSTIISKGETISLDFCSFFPKSSTCYLYSSVVLASFVSSLNRINRSSLWSREEMTVVMGFIQFENQRAAHKLGLHIQKLPLWLSWCNEWRNEMKSWLNAMT